MKKLISQFSVWFGHDIFPCLHQPISNNPLIVVIETCNHMRFAAFPHFARTAEDARFG
jgi:hypothetical protein